MFACEVKEPWEALIKVRMPRDKALIDTGALVRNSVLPHNVSLSHSLRGEVKPNPEINQLISKKTKKMPPPQCLVLEYSPPCLRTALAAGMWVIAITTPFARSTVRSAGIHDDRWIVDGPIFLRRAVDEMLNERRQGAV